MDDGYIRGRKMTDMEFFMCESDRAFQKTVDALNEIGCTSFQLSEEEIKQILKDDRSIKYDSLCN